MNSVVAGIAEFVANTGEVIASLGDTVFEKSFSKLRTLTITSDDTFRNGWSSVRDFANMFIVLGFVIIGISFTLRLESYGSKKVLISLIIVALLINFSGIFMGLLIDAANIAIGSISLQGTTGGGFGNGLIIAVDDAWDSKMTICVDDTNYVDWSYNAVLFATIYFFIGISLLFTAIILIIRYVMLAVLFVFSPLAFFAWVFPATKKYFTMWWEKVLKWLLAGVAGVFFLWIGAQMLAGHTEKGWPELNETIFILVKVLLFIIAGFILSLKGSGVIGKMAVGLASGAAGFAMGAVKAGGMAGLKGLGKVSGMTEVGRNIGHKATRLAEQAGLVKSGTSAGWEKSRIEKDKKQYDNMTSNDLARDVNRGAATTAGRKANDIKARILAERGDFDKIPEANRDTVARRAIVNDKTGDALSSFKKADPRFARFDNEKVNEKIQRAQQAGAPITREAAQRAVVADTVKRTAPGDTAKWSPPVVTPEVFGSLNKNQLIEMGKRGTGALVDHLKKFKRSRDAAGNVNPLAMQSAEYQALNNHILTNYGAGSPEATRVAQILNEMETNAVFR